MFRRWAPPVLVLLTLVACSSDPATVAVGTSPTVATAESTSPSPSITPAAGAATGETASSEPATDPTVATTAAGATTAASTTAAVVTDPPQTGVPGEAAADPLCAAYGTLLTTEYLVGLVEAFGDEPGARRAEAVAASTVVGAVDTAAGALGAEAPDSGLAGRWAAAVARAETALASGLDAGAASVVWADVLRSHDRNDPQLSLALDAGLDAQVDAAAAAIESAHGPLATDPAYLDSATVATPSIDARLRERCPDVAALESGDAV